MRDLPVSRRQFLAISGGAAIWFTASPTELLAASGGDVRDAATGAVQGYRVLTTAQAAVFDAFAAQVIPSEAGSPGAHEANVVRFIDNGLGGFAKSNALSSRRASLRSMRKPGSSRLAADSPR